jgi:hypothetical protein
LATTGYCNWDERIGSVDHSGNGRIGSSLYFLGLACTELNVIGALLTAFDRCECYFIMILLAKFFNVNCDLHPLSLPI